MLNSRFLVKNLFVSFLVVGVDAMVTSQLLVKLFQTPREHILFN